VIMEKTIMLTATKETRTSHVPLPCCVMVASTRPSLRAECGKPSRLKRPPGVLVVDFRDEVYSALKSLLEAHGLSVLRATRGAEVAAKTRDLAPRLVLIYEDMPGESGWLIACKLRFGLNSGPIWLYTARCPRCLADRQKATGVDQVIQCGRSLLPLLEEVDTRIVEWRMYRFSPAVTSPLRFRSA
jgi:CheY-like chemotaxis protein